MARIVVLGGGRVGAAIARDLCTEHSVTVADLDPAVAERFNDDDGISTATVDLASDELRSVIEGADLVVGAVPGHMGFETLKRIIEAGKNVVDISFFPEDMFALDELAKEKNVTAVVDCGVAPGLSNMVLGRMHAEWDNVTRFSCCVGGLPQERKPPWEYQAPFSPSDVIEEYTRPARLVRNGKEVTLLALSELENLEFEGVGTLEAFNTDGLRSLLTTIDAEDMSEKTLRYPGHVARIEALRDSGLLDTTPVAVGGVEIVPRDVTSKLLFDKWLQRPGDKDLTVMRIEVAGSLGGKDVSVRYDMLDRYDEKTNTTSMARTTGYTCTAVVRAMLEGLVTAKGIVPPETVAVNKNAFDFVLERLDERGVSFSVATVGG